MCLASNRKSPSRTAPFDARLMQAEVENTLQNVTNTHSTAESGQQYLTRTLLRAVLHELRIYCTLRSQNAVAPSRYKAEGPCNRGFVLRRRAAEIRAQQSQSTSAQNSCCGTLETSIGPASFECARRDRQHQRQWNSIRPRPVRETGCLSEAVRLRGGGKGVASSAYLPIFKEGTCSFSFLSPFRELAG